MAKALNEARFLANRFLINDIKIGHSSERCEGYYQFLRDLFFSCAKIVATIMNENVREEKTAIKKRVKL